MLIYQQLLMLVRAEVSRRTETLNDYLAILKEKVNSQKYKEAIHLISKSRDSINSSYMAAYDPNLYLLDSLRNKTDKLVKEKEALEGRLLELNQRIENKKLKKGLILGLNQNIVKSSLNNVGVYASRIALTLKDSHKVDYEQVSVETDFFSIKFVLGSKNIEIRYSEIITFQAGLTEILLSWRNKVNHLQNFILISFEDEQSKSRWEKTIKFSKLIDESKSKKNLFMKPTPTDEKDGRKNYLQVNGYHSKNLEEEKNNNHDIESIVNNVRRRKSSMMNPKQLSSRQSYTNLAHNTSYFHSRASGYDRIRRQSEYSPFAKKFNPEDSLKNSSRRKISADYTSEKFKFNLGNSANSILFNQRKMTLNKSQKSFDGNSHSTSNRNKKEKEPQIQSIIEEKQIPILTFRDKDQKSSQKPRQIFVNNQSSVHWIQEEHEDDRSRESFKIPTSQSGDRILNAFEEAMDSRRISQQELVDGEESPTLPYNLHKGKNGAKFDNKITLTPIQKQQENSDKKDEVEKKDEIIDKKQEEEVYDQESQVVRIGEINLVERTNQQQDNNEEDDSDEEDSEDNERDHQTSSIVSENQTQKFYLEDLNKGITVLKCAQNGWQPHLKKLYLSVNHNDLCWSDSKGENKSIPLSKIVAINKGHRGKGIAKHMKNQPSLQRCLLIKTQIGTQNKFLEFFLQTKFNVEILGEFTRKLQTYWKFKVKQQI